MKRPTLRDLAREAGCSITTVSHALNGTRYVNAETREKIQSLAYTMGYQPDPFARILQGQETLLIGHILSSLHDNAFFSLVAQGADQRAQESGYITMLSVTDGRAEAEERAVRTLLQQRVRGILFTTAISAANVEIAVASGVTTVMVERPLPVRGAHAVMVDHRAGVYDLTNLLIAQGHRDLAFIGANFTATHNGIVERQRIQGFRDALREASLKVPASHICLVPTFDMNYGRSACEALLRTPERPTALVLGSDMLAAGVLQVLYEHGLHIPNDISLVSCDDTKGPYMSPPLTEFEPRTVELGRQAVDLIVTHAQQTQGSRGSTGIIQRIILQPHLNVRASTRQLEPQDLQQS